MTLFGNSGSCHWWHTVHSGAIQYLTYLLAQKATFISKVLSSKGELG